MGEVSKIEEPVLSVAAILRENSSLIKDCLATSDYINNILTAHQLDSITNEKEPNCMMAEVNMQFEDLKKLSSMLKEVRKLISS